jgi:hypothetical protein
LRIRFNELTATKAQTPAKRLAILTTCVLGHITWKAGQETKNSSSYGIPTTSQISGRRRRGRILTSKLNPYPPFEEAHNLYVKWVDEFGQDALFNRAWEVLGKDYCTKLGQRIKEKSVGARPLSTEEMERFTAAFSWHVIHRYIAKELHDRQQEILTDMFTDRHQIGILSLSSRWDSPAMWAHYSSNHQGIVIGFDSECPTFYNNIYGESMAARKVEYVDFPTRPITFSDFQKCMPSGAAFFFKDRSWNYEEEWRALRVLNDANLVIKGEPFRAIHLFDYPADSVQEVILGQSISLTCSNTIRTLLKSERFKNAELYRASKSPGSYRMNRVTV